MNNFDAFCMVPKTSLIGNVSNPYSSNPDPDPAKNLNPDPDPGRP